MKTVFFGELLLRLSPPEHQRFLQSSAFRCHIGGAEANAALALAQMGEECALVTTLPRHELGQMALNELRRYGVETGEIQRADGRMGLYFLENGASQRASSVIYDRRNSTAAEADPACYDWERILAGADWLHFTGITAAISENAAQSCLDAVRAARRLGVRVSCDLNYRANLWSPQRAGEVMGELLPFCDLLIANVEHAGLLFGIRSAHSGRQELEDVSAALAARFGCRMVAVTLREGDSASENTCGAMLWDASNEKAVYSRSYHIQIVDRIGGGDAFDAGLLYGLGQGWDAQRIVEFAMASSALKHSVEGDFGIASAAEIAALAESGSAGRVRR